MVQAGSEAQEFKMKTIITALLALISITTYAKSRDNNLIYEKHSITMQNQNYDYRIYKNCINGIEYLVFIGLDNGTSGLIARDRYNHPVECKNER